ncbi:hypothetical protein [Streptomyces sp. NPDC001978]|uniref:hypothetical protein n=1 Tax=Streptomyces sp. NPDC001978 TaxID=3364627 RepID=UPI0036C3E2AA
MAGVLRIPVGNLRGGEVEMRTRDIVIGIVAGIAGAALLIAIDSSINGSSGSSSGDAKDSSPTPVQVVACNKDGSGLMDMKIRATNQFHDVTAYMLQLYWFSKDGTQLEGVKMTTDAIEPGKSITFTVDGNQYLNAAPVGRTPRDDSHDHCEVKVLGAQ